MREDLHKGRAGDVLKEGRRGRRVIGDERKDEKRKNKSEVKITES